MNTKNLLKFVLVMVLIGVFAFGFNTTVRATTELKDLENFEGITKTSNGDGSYTLTLNKLTNINLEIKSGEKVTLDLNGYDLDNTSKEGMPTILVNQGAELTIINSGDSGYIRRDMVIPDFKGSQPVIRNNGTLTIKGGTILTSEQSCYGIENSGKLTISGGGITVSTETTYGIFNNKTGEVTITDGRFQQGAVPNGHSADAPLVVNQGKLNITGGTFLNNTGKKVPSIADVTGGTASVTGGKFVYQDPDSGAQENQDMSTLIPSNYELDNNGNVVEKQEPTEQQPTEQQPTGQEPTEQQPAEQQPAGQEPAGQEPAGQQPAEQQPVEQQPAGQEPTEQQSIGQQSATEELDDEPKTGDANSISVVLVSVLSLAGIVMSKKFIK